MNIKNQIKKSKLNASERNPRNPNRGLPAVSQDWWDHSSSLRMIQKIQEAALAASDIRTEKIAPLKKKIEDGSYPVQVGKVASQMLKEFLLEHNK